MGLIRGLGCEIGFGPCGVSWLPVYWLRLGFENRGIPAMFDWRGWWVSAAVAATRGLVRGLGRDIGFGSALGPLPVWRLAGLGPGAAGFRRFRMSADCGRLSDRLFPWTDSEIGHRNRIRSVHGCAIGCVPD